MGSERFSSLHLLDESFTAHVDMAHPDCCLEDLLLWSDEERARFHIELRDPASCLALLDPERGLELPSSGLCYELCAHSLARFIRRYPVWNSEPEIIGLSGLPFPLGPGAVAQYMDHWYPDLDRRPRQPAPLIQEPSDAWGIYAIERHVEGAVVWLVGTTTSKDTSGWFTLDGCVILTRKTTPTRAVATLEADLYRWHCKVMQGKRVSPGRPVGTGEFRGGTVFADQVRAAAEELRRRGCRISQRTVAQQLNVSMRHLQRLIQLHHLDWSVFRS